MADTTSDHRSLFRILYPCFLVIVTSTFSAVHPDVPRRDSTFLSRHVEKLRIVLLALAVPEIVVASAGRQYLLARQHSNNE
ncbi:hypothetical protein C8J57DRAFT_1068010 [Mycena rebaudengoi]|nr:hypothetical protein C8J57DRAFT_1068010 [Mycena rebaudengoi]